MAELEASQFLFPDGDSYCPAAYASPISSSSLSQKQELVYQAAKGSSACREALESWTRKDLLQLLCLEMGKERKYTGSPKVKLVELLLKLVSKRVTCENTLSSAASQSPPRRQRKPGRPSRVPSMDNQGSVIGDNAMADLSGVCRNTACKAQLQPGTLFCKRCSCCICQKFDDNKDPSLWIVCTPDSFGGDFSCGLSCHLECALNNKVAGVVIEGSKVVLDGSYHCGTCGKISSLIGCWRKQLMVARDARRVDIFCHRLSLSHRLLDGTRKYRNLHEFVEKATKLLEAEVGSLTEGSAKLARCIVNRLSSTLEIQKLICMGLEKAELLPKATKQIGQGSKPHDKRGSVSFRVEFNEVTASSVMLTVRGGGYVAGEPVIGYKLWHRLANDTSYPENPTCVFPGNVVGKAAISCLHDCSEYVFCIIPFTEKLFGDPFEAHCFTKSIDCSKQTFDSHLKTASDQHLDIFNANTTESKELDDSEPSFKVRDIGKSLHLPRGHCDQGDEDIHCGKGDMKDGDDTLDLRERTVDDRARMPPSDLNATMTDGGSGEEDDHVIVEVSPIIDLVDPQSRRDSSGLLQESDVTESPAERGVRTKVTEVEDASDLEDSRTSRREEFPVVSPNDSGSLQANGGNETVGGSEETPRTDDIQSNGHNGRSWAVQVRNLGAPLRVDPLGDASRKRGLGGLQTCFGVIHGCDMTDTHAPLCAEKSYELCVKIIRWLECEGHLKGDFRMKFLTWFSLRASDHEKRVVRVFIDTLQDDPATLAAQLMDTFTDAISTKRQQVTASDFCERIWH